MTSNTIYALSSGAGRAGVAVVRVSGRGAAAAWRTLAGRDVPETRRMVRVRLHDGTRALDDGLGVYFAAPASFTGEDVVEFHVHGGRAVVEAVLRTLGRCEGLRPAEPGEFTRRAFENGRLDLTAAEGIRDLVDAETEAQRAQALRQADGALGQLYDGWRAGVVRALGLVEGAIDFSDEGLEESLIDEARVVVGGLLQEMRRHIEGGRRGERVREGFYVAIVGAPNVGKSSLLNRLAGREAAIVSETAGTTRDVVEVRMDLGGYAVTVADTAGLREAGDAVEQEGVRRALAAAARADLTVVVDDGRGESGGTEGGPRLRVRNKIDVAPGGRGEGGIGVSARTGEGMTELEQAIVRELEKEWRSRGDEVVWTRERHRHAIAGAAEELETFLGAAAAEIGAEHLRRAARALGRVIGTVDVEDVLDMIFREFCIGK